MPCALRAACGVGLPSNNGNVQSHARANVYGPSMNDAKLTVYETVATSTCRHSSVALCTGSGDWPGYCGTYERDNFLRRNIPRAIKALPIIANVAGSGVPRVGPGLDENVPAPATLNGPVGGRAAAVAVSQCRLRVKRGYR
jgi:hypothetical protein